MNKILPLIAVASVMPNLFLPSHLKHWLSSLVSWMIGDLFQSPDQYGPLGPAQKIYIRYFSRLEVKRESFISNNKQEA